MNPDTPPPSSATRDMCEAMVAGADSPIAFDCVRARGLEGIQFDVWYCNTRLPALAAAYPGRRVRRYAVPSRASQLAICELETLPDRDEVPAAVPEVVGHVERFVGVPLGLHRRRDAGAQAIEAAVVYPAFLRVPSHRLDEVGRWYEQEHLPMLLSCPQWMMTRRFHITAATGVEWNHVALHYLSDLRALQSPERDAARNTPWRDRLIAEGWFAPEYRVCYRAQELL